MTKTTISKTGMSEVTLTAVDPYTDEKIEWCFWIPISGGYIREGSMHSANDKQVCVGLSSRGNTLRASDGDELLRVIRREWRRYRADAKKFA